MIAFLDGTLCDKAPTRAVVDAGGVGYEVFIPLGTYDRLPRLGERCRVLIHDHVREDAHLLFGFGTEEEKDLFERLIGVTGLGPKLAISVLSGLPPRELKRALVEGDAKRLGTISGIGKKTAERMVLELRDKFTAGEKFEAVSGEASGGDTRMSDAALALVSLGYKEDQARKMLRAAEKDITEQTTVEEIVRHALAG
ncbi:Holliday junction branch migration protein RuvA [Kiritimatiella glycovorans]|uniref:Holliday junction branch migration complex subunit RuvA n=1 Tax=Kiritimatiella glycovorans TaxID=1307763 RepID=A0A0G3ELJ1_9BACT|nr:Holliday junction branch migration protein RuvA [Kiritimatiella glycovorans]AKJ65655.1 Holliday junction ATP-dependent DNA helicase RuvA [Kiritimatiella glycovorans]